MFTLLALLLLLLAGTAVLAETNPPPAGGAAPPAGDGSTGNTGTPPAGSPEGETISLEEARKLRSEAKNLRDRLKEAEAKLSPLEQLQARVKEQETLLSSRDRELLAFRAEKALAKAAPDALYPDVLLAKLDLSQLLTDKGEIDAAKLSAAVTGLRKDYAKLFSGSALGEAAGAGGGSGGQLGGNAAINQAIRGALRRAS